MNTNHNKKCLIINNNECLIIVDKNMDDKYFCKLPLLDNIKESIKNENKIIDVNDNFSILKTKDEISPWNLFDPFPPENYYDYGYLILKNKSGEFTSNTSDKPAEITTYRYWELLSINDKKLINLYING